jgi:uncharacterized HAD superfamily protein
LACNLGVIMIHPSSIAFDIDGVFADILSLFIEIAGSKFNINGLKYHDITTYDLRDCLEIDPLIIDKIIELILSGSYCSSLKPVEGAREVLTRLGNYNGKILFVTARAKEYPIYDWILNMLPLDPSVIHIEATGTFEKKTEVLLKHNITYFVEDRLETCFMLNDAGINPVLFKQPWNRKEHPFIEVNTWGELESLINFQ